MSQTQTLSAEEQRTLACVAELMIPASAEYAVPGANDPTILADMLTSLGRDGPAVRVALARLDARADGRFAELAKAGQEEVAATFRAEGGAALAALSRLILQCYYRDDRVMRALNMEVRPPFPKGHVLEQGDWSLLDPVRKRPKLWRDAP
jgi:hypothetical protein